MPHALAWVWRKLKPAPRQQRDALWIHIQKRKHNDTIQVSDDVFVDYDADMNVLSIEILGASKMLKEIAGGNSKVAETAT